MVPRMPTTTPTTAINIHSFFIHNDSRPNGGRSDANCRGGYREYQTLEKGAEGGSAKYLFLMWRRTVEVWRQDQSCFPLSSQLISNLSSIAKYSTGTVKSISDEFVSNKSISSIENPCARDLQTKREGSQPQLLVFNCLRGPELLPGVL